MSDDLLDYDLDGTKPPSQRPQFLTVLCILTFIGSGLGIFGILSNSREYYASFQPMWYTIVGLACNAGTAYGAWEMWNLKRRGLIIYTVSQVAAIVLPYLLFWSILGSFGGGLIGNAFTIASLIPIAFIAMYWSNAKYLDDGYSDLD